MKKILIFGGSGFLGSYVADELTKRDYKVIIADKNKSPYLQNDQEFIHIDIMNGKKVETLVQNVDIVYNFAAVAEIDKANSKVMDTFNINVLGNINILEACRKYRKIIRYIFASSVYAMSDQGSFYGISKHTSEKIIEEYYKKFGLKYTIIRYGSLYGERASSNNFIYKLIHEALTLGELRYKGDGNDVREYIHAADAAKLSVDILENEEFENQIVVFTGLEKFTRKELLTMINEIMGNKLKLVQIEKDFEGHYKITPYAFHPTMAKKLVANPYIDMGQGLLECIKKISEEINKE